MNRKYISILPYIFLIILFIFTIYPIIYVILGSFESNQELVLGGMNLFPKRFILQNYIDAWRLANFMRYTWNSIYMSLSIMLGTLIISTMTGYCLARKNFPGKRIFLGALIAFMFISIGSVNLRPLFDLAVRLNLHTSLLGVILISIGNEQTRNIFLAMGYIKTLPKELDEAAIIDGCSFFRVYWNIILPLMKPMLATICILSFRTGWNEYILPLVFTMTRPDLRPLTVGVISLRFTQDGAAAWNIMFAGATLSIVPIIMVFIFANKHFLSGMTSGAMKG
ncbi:MAG: carbohydrate ABC transporter permease [Bacteroidota bacterium]